MPDIDLNRPEDLLECHVKLRGSLAGGMCASWVRAAQYALVENHLTPLFTLYNASLQRFRRIDEHRFEITMLEISYFLDAATNARLDTFTNPFSGLSGPVPPALFGPHTVTLTTNGLQAPEHFPFGTLTFNGRLGPAHTDGTDIWLREETEVITTPADPASATHRYTELVTYRGSWRDINDPSLAAAPASIAYTTASDWRPWMQPGATPGQVLSNGFGKKVGSIEDLPADYLELAATHNPDVLAAPEDLLDGPPPFPPAG